MSHAWSVARESCEGYYAGIACRVYRARCQHCGLTTTFPTEPRKGMETPVLPECVPMAKAPENIPENMPSQIQKEGTQKPGAVKFEDLPKDTQEKLRPQFAKEETMTQGNIRPRLKGVAAHARGLEYRQHWSEILADAKAMGAKATRQKWGIPLPTWCGWLKNHPDLAAIVSTSVSNNGHAPEAPKAEAKPTETAKHRFTPHPEATDKYDAIIKAKDAEIADLQKQLQAAKAITAAPISDSFNQKSMVNILTAIADHMEDDNRFAGATYKGLRLAAHLVEVA